MDMRRRSDPRLYFRYTDPPDPSDDPPRLCLLDVCVNIDLLEALKEHQDVKDYGVLLRIHWDETGNPDVDMSTLTLSQVPTDSSSGVLNTDYAIGISTNHTVLENFITKMFATYNMKLVAVQYPPMVLTFKHGLDSGISRLTSDKTRLHGFVKELITQCTVAKHQMQLKINMKRGSKVVLSQRHACGCFGHEQGSDGDSCALQADNSSQTDENHYASMSSLSTMCDDTIEVDHKAPSSVEVRFKTVESELAEQRHFMESQFYEQKGQNEEIKAALLQISDVLAQKGEQEESRRKEEPQLAKDILDEPDLMQFSLETEPSKSESIGPQDESEHQTEVKVQGKGESQSGEELVEEVNRHQMRDESEEEESNVKVTEVEEENMVSEEEEESTNDDEEVDVESESGEEYSEYHYQKRKGPIIKEIDGNELRSLSPPRTEQEMRFRTSKHKPTVYNGTNSRSTYYLIGKYPQASQHNSQSSVKQKQPTTYTGNVYNDDLSGVDPYKNTRYKTHTCPLHGNYFATQQTAAPLTRPQRQAGRMTGSHAGDLDDFGLSGPVNEDLWSERDVYSDLQTDELNFDISRRDRRKQESYTIDGQVIMTKTRLCDEPNGEQRMQTLLESMVGEQDSADSSRMWESVAEAQCEDSSTVPSVEAALDTVICIDTSDSVKGEAFQQITTILHDFINGIEDIAEQYEMEENIALVTFGGRARVLHQLSNDYGSLRDAIDTLKPGGPSPLNEGLLVAMTCTGRGGILNIGGSLKLPPRFIIITDGLATGTLPEAAQDGHVTSEQEKAVLTHTFSQLRQRQPGDYVPHPVVVVPVGRSDMSFLLSMGRLCGGMLIEGSAIRKLCRHQRLHKLAGDSLELIRDKRMDSAMFEDLRSRQLTIQLSPDTKQDEMEDVRDLTQEHLYKVAIVYGSKYSFANIYEAPSLPSLGTRVVRSQDWVWGNQDTEGAGTIINHGLDAKYVWVYWDSGHLNVYRFGQNGCYDVTEVHDQPRVLDGGGNVDVGLQVERGPDWHMTYGDQDGGRGGTGAIIRVNMDGKVMVRWQNGNIYVYRFGETNKFDLSIRDPVACLLESTAKPDGEQPARHEQLSRTGPEQHIARVADSYLWQREDKQRGWQDYSPSDSDRITSAYKKRSEGSCLLQRNNESYRVMFKSMQEKSITNQSTVRIRKRAIE
ncbi:uncharacterized protein LOC124280402 isoform X2 [Haliotis rubra]|nr:uncharacterized protein LOC124280402 isoform X2 [Haliotis rubra]XP_046572269.1 uncharacterized protein LOC124280402 isoform X2 [Haliotis rubra]